MEDQRRERHRHDGLNDEDRGRDLHGGPAPQRAHLAEHRHGVEGEGRAAPQRGVHEVTAAQRALDERRGDGASRVPEAGREHRDLAELDAGERERVGHRGRRREAAQREGERRAVGLGVVLSGHDERESGDAREDARDRESVAALDRLVQQPLARHEQHEDPDRQRGLHERDRRQREGPDLKRPAEHGERRPSEPARPAREAHEQRRAQVRVGGGVAGVQRLHGEAPVEQRRGDRGGQNAEQELHAHR